MSQFSRLQIFIITAIETSSPLVIFAIVADDTPIAFRKSVLVISLSIRIFQSFLYDTLILLFLPK